MSRFGDRNLETNEGELGNSSGENVNEIPDTNDGKEKLDTGDIDRNKEFRDSFKVEPSSDNSDGREKLDTGTTDESGDGRGDSEISYDGGRTDETGRD